MNIIEAYSEMTGGKRVRMKHKPSDVFEMPCAYHNEFNRPHIVVNTNMFHVFTPELITADWEIAT